MLRFHILLTETFSNCISLSVIRKNDESDVVKISAVFRTLPHADRWTVFKDFKLKPQVITYRNYKNYNNDRFQGDIKTCGFDTKDINSFKQTILSVFSKYAPIKKKYIRANEAPFMTKNLHKEIMKRSRLRNNIWSLNPWQIEKTTIYNGIFVRNF